MKKTKKISRQDFIKNFPQFMMSHIRALTRKAGRPFETNTDGPEALPDNFYSTKVVQLNREYCLAWEGGSCQFCYLACPLRDKAILMEDQKPVINAGLCDGCAQCITACQTVNDTPAITMVLT
jgi:Pyruvate/2-oxoacid:ferredoxin oxidoreductase delta subunit